MNKRKYRMVIAEDEPIILRNIVTKLQQADPFFETVGAAMDGVEALRMVEETRPHLLVTDIQMPRMEGITLIREVSRRFPDTVVVVLSNYREFEYVRQALQYGVREYLIKTITVEDARKVLAGIRATLEQRDNARLSEWIAARLRRQSNGLSADAASRGELPAWSRELRLQVFYISVGNVGRHRLFPDLLRSFRAALEQADLRAGLEGLLPPGARCWTADSGASQPGLYLAVDWGGPPPGLSEFADALLRRTEQVLSCRPVGIFYSTAPCGCDSLEDCSYRLLQMCDSHKVYGESRIYPLEIVGEPEPGISGKKAAQLIRRVMASPDRPELVEAVEAMASCWRHKDCRQRTIERHILLLFQELHHNSRYLSDMEIDHLEHDLLYHMYRQGDLSWLQRELVGIAAAALLEPSSAPPQDMEEVVLAVERLLREHFTSPVSLEELAAQFHVSTSYLSKSFKRQLGTSPIKYVITLRMEEAKRLMARKPALSFKQIGALVGYEDQNYFSRMFKSCTGTSLTEYSRST